MYAVIKTGGKQYRVVAGEKIKVEQIPAEVGTQITVAGFTRMHEEGRGAGTGQRGGNLAGDMAGLAHAADNDASRTVEDEVQRLQESLVKTVGKRQHGVAFDS